MNQRGKNRGLTGLLNCVLEQPGGSAQSYNYTVYISNYTLDIQYQVIGREGPGANAPYPSNRLGDLRGGGSFEGEVQLSGYPLPSNPKYATGTLTLATKMIPNTSGTMTVLNGLSFPARITNMDIAHHESAADLPDISGKWVVAGAITIIWGGTQVTITPPSPNDATTWDGLEKIYDANGLQTGARQRIDCEGIGTQNSDEFTKLVSLAATATIGQSLKVRTVSMSRMDSGGIQAVIHWDLLSTADSQTGPNVHSFRAAEDPYTDSISAVVDAGTANIATQANVLWDAFRTNNFAQNLSLLYRNDQKRLAIYRYVNPRIRVIGRSGADEIEAPCRFSGGNVQLFPLVNKTTYAASNFHNIIFSRMILTNIATRRFRIVRMVTGTSIPEQYPSTINGTALPLWRQVNSATFLGLTAGTVMFMETDYHTVYDPGVTNQFYMIYEFLQNDNGFYTSFPEQIFKPDGVPVVTSSTASNQWVNASAYTMGGVALSSLIVQPSTASFGGFIA